MASKTGTGLPERTVSKPVGVSLLLFTLYNDVINVVTPKKSRGLNGSKIGNKICVVKLHGRYEWESSPRGVSVSIEIGSRQIKILVLGCREIVERA